MSERPPPFPSPPPPPGGTRPPPSDASMPRGVVLKGIAGSPGVAVGSALVVGDMRAAYAQAPCFERADRGGGRAPDAGGRGRQAAPPRSQRQAPDRPAETNAILDAYLMMVGDPMLIERVTKKIRSEKKCAEWAVAQASDEIAKLFAPPDANERDAYIAERRHDVEFVCDRLLRALAGRREADRPAPRSARRSSSRAISRRPTPPAWSASRSSPSSPRSARARATPRSWRARSRSRRSSAWRTRSPSFAPATP